MNTGRWTIQARVEPRRRRPCVPTLRARVHVRCVCGVERIVWLEDIEAGRSTGCESRRCAARFLAAGDIRVMLTGWIERERVAMLDAITRGQAVDAFAAERLVHMEQGIRDYLRTTTGVYDLEPQKPTEVFARRA